MKVAKNNNFITLCIVLAFYFLYSTINTLNTPLPLKGEFIIKDINIPD